MGDSDSGQPRGVFPETIVLGTGVTALINPIQGQNGLVLKYGSGGTLWIKGVSTTVTYGTTYATAVQYPLGTTEALSLNLSGSIYLQATGATTTAYLLRTRSIFDAQIP